MRNQIAPNVPDPPVKPKFFPLSKGYHPCRRCKVCTYNITKKKSINFRSTVTGVEFPIKQFSTCATRYVVYLLTCPCGKQYVGRTIRSFSTRAGEHIAKILAGYPKHTVPRHYLEHHNKKVEGTLFQIIDHFVPHWRGEPGTRGVSKLEVYWIYQLKSYTPHGLNVEWDVNSFINQS